jgi:uncharacterized protein YecT (DUF1311 family)
MASQRFVSTNGGVGIPRLAPGDFGGNLVAAIVRNRMTAKAFSLLLLAVFVCMPFQPVLAQGGWLAQCMNDSTGDLSDAECYVEYTNRLKREQFGVIRRIKTALSRQGPAETNYPKALTLLNQSQKKWLSFVTTDCAIVTEVFGGGNAVGFAEESCVIEHYKARNAMLKKLEADFLSN